MEPRCERLRVHLDVEDAVDFTDLPLFQNTGRNEGLPFDVAVRALGRLLRSEKPAALTVTEFDPDHGPEDWSTAAASTQGLARALAGVGGRDRPGELHHCACPRDLGPGDRLRRARWLPSKDL